jgi:RNA polymerase sigma-70 factor (ECF subfamily)
MSAEDVYQNTLLIAYTHLHQLRDENKFKSWIFKIAKHEAFHYINKANSEVPMELLDNILFEQYYDESTPEKIVLSNELKNALINAVNSLSKEDRDIVILYYYADLSLKEISKLFNANENKIKSRHRSIKIKIYKDLLSQGLIPEFKKPFSIVGGTRSEQK